MEHDFRHAARQVDAHRRMVHRAVGQHGDQARHAAVHRDPIFHARAGQPGRVGDGRHMQYQICRAAERGIDRHGVADAAAVRMSPVVNAALLQRRCARRDRGPCPARWVAPDGASAEWGKRQSQRFADDLRRGGRAQELAARRPDAQARQPSPGRFLERDFSVGVSHADRLHHARVFAFIGRAA